MDNNELTEKALRLAELTQQRDALDAEINLIKAQMLEGRQAGDVLTINGREAYKVVTTHRWDETQARQILTPEQIEAITVAKVDPATAKRILPPAIYDACRKPGDPYLKAV